MSCCDAEGGNTGGLTGAEASEAVRCQKTPAQTRQTFVCQLSLLVKI